MPTVCRSLLPGLLFATVLQAQQAPGDWIRTLLRDKDDADFGPIEEIAGNGTRETAVGLLQAYDVLVTLLYRREVVRGSGQLASLPEAEQPVLRRLVNLAGGPAVEDEVRSLAITGLGQSPTVGQQILQQIVDGDARDSLRGLAMREHIKPAAAGDASWYRHLWNLKREVDPRIRHALLGWMHEQTMLHTVQMAEWLLDRVDVPGADRGEAARILFEHASAKVAPFILGLAKERDVAPEDLRLAMAQLIAGQGDETTGKRMAKLIGKDMPHGKGGRSHKQRPESPGPPRWCSCWPVCPSTRP